MLTDRPKMISALTAAKVNWLDIFLEIVSTVDWSQFLLCRGNLMDLFSWWSLSPDLLNSSALVRFPLSTSCSVTLMFAFLPEWVSAEIDWESDCRLTGWEDVDPVSFLM